MFEVDGFAMAIEPVIASAAAIKPISRGKRAAVQLPVGDRVPIQLCTCPTASASASSPVRLVTRGCGNPEDVAHLPALLARHAMVNRLCCHIAHVRCQDVMMLCSACALPRTTRRS